MSDRRTHNPEQTQDALLDAAETLFAARGFDGTRTDEIARVSGVNKAMISYYFGGKRGLYKAMLDRNLAPALARMDELSHTEASAPERLGSFIRIFADLHISRPNLSVIVLREVLSSEGRNIDDGPLPAFLKVFATLRQILEQGRREGTLLDVPIPLAHLSMMGGLVFFFSTRGFRARVSAEGKAPFVDVEPEEFVSFYLDVMTRGLTPGDRSVPATKKSQASKSSTRHGTRAAPESSSAKPKKSDTSSARTAKRVPHASRSANRKKGEK